jgi:hypothetical protein
MFRPFDSVARASLGNAGAGASAGSGSFLRSAPVGAAASCGKGRMSSAYSPSDSHDFAARCTLAVEAPATLFSVFLYASGLPA